jgi:hypothetical protein
MPITLEKLELEDSVCQTVAENIKGIPSVLYQSIPTSATFEFSERTTAPQYVIPANQTSANSR